MVAASHCSTTSTSKKKHKTINPKQKQTNFLAKSGTIETKSPKSKKKKERNKQREHNTQQTRPRLKPPRESSVYQYMSKQKSKVSQRSEVGSTYLLVIILVLFVLLSISCQELLTLWFSPTPNFNPLIIHLFRWEGELWAPTPSPNAKLQNKCFFSNSQLGWNSWIVILFLMSQTVHIITKNIAIQSFVSNFQNEHPG